jgi:hypothetical protein
MLDLFHCAGLSRYQNGRRVQMPEKIITEAENAIRELTVAELEVVSGAGLPGAPQPDTCSCPKPGN